MRQRADHIAIAIGLQSICAGCISDSALRAAEFTYIHSSIRWVYRSGDRVVAMKPAYVVYGILSLPFPVPKGRVLSIQPNEIVAVAPGAEGTIILTETCFREADSEPFFTAQPKAALAVENGASVFGHAVGRPVEQDIGEWFGWGGLHYFPDVGTGRAVSGVRAWVFLYDSESVGPILHAYYVPEYNVVIALASYRDQSRKLAICIDVARLPELAARIEHEYPRLRESVPDPVTVPEHGTGEGNRAE